MTDARREAVEALLERVWDKAFTGGHREACRKYSHVGVECSCGADDLAQAIALLTPTLRAYDAVVEELDNLRGAYHDMRAMGLPDVATLRAQHAALVEWVKQNAWHDEDCEQILCGYDRSPHNKHDEACACTCGFGPLLATLGGAEGA
jgi:hypothetical protein